MFGGIEHHVRLLAGAQAVAGDEVEVLTTAARHHVGQSREHGVLVTRVPRVASAGVLASTPISPALWGELRRRSVMFDVLHVHVPYPFAELGVRLWPLRTGSATVDATYHADVTRLAPLAHLYALFLRWFLRRCDGVVATSQVYVKSSRVLAPLAKVAGKVTVVPLGIDVDPPPADAEAVAEVRRSLTPPVTLFVGRLRAYKGVDTLIEAMERGGNGAPGGSNGSDGSGVPGSLLIVGDGPEGERWRRRAAQSSAAARVHFTGEVPDERLAVYHAAADVVVLPSTNRSEAFGLAMAEAMAAGLPAVSTQLGTATSTVNVHGETGFVVPPSDPVALGSALRRLLADSSLRQRLGAAAAARIREHHDRRAMVAGIRSVYERAVAQREPPRGSTTLS